MPDGAGFIPPRGVIGPNAILQLVPVLDRELGVVTRRGLMAATRAEMPDGTTMIDQGPAVNLHDLLRRTWPEEAPAMLAEAGRGTADYIIANRIPGAVRVVLPTLPRPLARTLLTKAITAHAWTFAGSGAFRVAGTAPLTYEILANPLARAPGREAHVCHWHSAVFTRLFERLTGGRCHVTETACCATGAPACRFEFRFTRR